MARPWGAADVHHCAEDVLTINAVVVNATKLPKLRPSWTAILFGPSGHAIIGNGNCDGYCTPRVGRVKINMILTYRGFVGNEIE